MIQELCEAVWPEIEGWDCWATLAREMRRMNDAGSKTMEMRSATVFAKAKKRIRLAVDVVRMSDVEDVIQPLFKPGEFKQWLRGLVEVAEEAAGSFDTETSMLRARLDELEKTRGLRTAGVQPHGAGGNAGHGADGRLTTGLDFKTSKEKWIKAHPTKCFHVNVIGRCQPPDGAPPCTLEHSPLVPLEVRKAFVEAEGAKWIGK